MSLLVVLHLVLVAAYAGFQWTVRALVHPQFALATHDFLRYERTHQERVTRIVGAALGAVPAHRRLSHRWDPVAHRRLLRVESLRVALASLNTLAAGWLALS